jgi:phosphatidylserine/phosphatidylglycerophosphate/cardiolipin synthase-like enzyme
MSDLEILGSEKRSFFTTPHQTQYYQTITAAIRQAKTDISICQYVLAVSPSRHWQRSNKLLNELVDAHNRGVALRILYDRPKLRSPNLHSNAASSEILNKKGIPVRSLSVNKTLHIKLIIIDSKILFAGSHNLSNASLYSPFELSWECTDPFFVNSAQIYFNCLFNGSMSEPYSNALKGLKRGNGH